MFPSGGKSADSTMWEVMELFSIFPGFFLFFQVLSTFSIKNDILWRFLTKQGHTHSSLISKNSYPLNQVSQNSKNVNISTIIYIWVGMLRIGMKNLEILAPGVLTSWPTLHNHFHVKWLSTSLSILLEVPETIISAATTTPCDTITKGLNTKPQHLLSPTMNSQPLDYAHIIPKLDPTQTCHSHICQQGDTESHQIAPHHCILKSQCD